jgi:hypothetical protein
MTIIYALAAFGLAYIVGHSAITLAPREWLIGQRVGEKVGFVLATREWIVDMIECPACFGFWTGAVASLVGWVPFPLDAPAWACAFTWGLFTAGTNYVLARITNLITPPI